MDNTYLHDYPFMLYDNTQPQNDVVNIYTALFKVLPSGSVLIRADPSNLTILAVSDPYLIVTGAKKRTSSERKSSKLSLATMRI